MFFNRTCLGGCIAYLVVAFLLPACLQSGTDRAPQQQKEDVNKQSTAIVATATPSIDFVLKAAIVSDNRQSYGLRLGSNIPRR